MENYEFRKINEKVLQKRFSNYVLGIDAGGTNTNLAVGGVENSKPVLLYSLNFKTKDLDSLTSAINSVLDFSKETYNILPLENSIIESVISSILKLNSFIFIFLILFLSKKSLSSFQTFLIPIKRIFSFGKPFLIKALSHSS